MTRLVLTVLLCATSAVAQIKTVDGVEVYGACTASGGVPRTPPSPDKFTEQDYVEFTRSPCDIPCPDYRVRLYRTGKVEWEGGHLVETRGPAAGQAESAASPAIFAEVQSPEYWAACDSYFKLLTDQISYTLSVHIGGQSKSIWDYALAGPTWVRELMRKIDEAAGSKKWVGHNWSPIYVK